MTRARHWGRWQHGGGSGSGSTVTVASLAAETAAWGKRNFGGRACALGSMAVEWWQRRQPGVGGGCGSGSSAAGSAMSRVVGRGRRGSHIF